MFDWDEANVAHIARHGVEKQEAEEVVLNKPLDLAYVSRNNEDRIEQIGETATGRILRIVTTIRDGRIRVITDVPVRRRYHDRYRKLREARNAAEKATT